MQPRKSRLGKDPFAQDTATATRALTVVTERSSVDLESITVDVDDIEVDDTFNARTEYPEEEIEALAQSIQEKGLLNPPTLRHRPHRKPSYFLVAGFKRLRALRRLGVGKVPARLCRSERDVDAYLLNLAENTDRSDLSAFDLAQRCAWLSENYGLSGTEISQRVKLSKAHVNNLIRLTKQLHPEVLSAFRAEHPAAQVQRLVGLCSRAPEDQLKVWNQLQQLERRAAARTQEQLQQEDTESSPDEGELAGKGRPTQRVMQKAIKALQRLPEPDEWRRGYIEALQWALGAGAAPSVDVDLGVRRGRPVRSER